MWRTLMLSKMWLQWCGVIVILVAIVNGTTEPTNIACTALNSTTMQVTWTQASDATVSGYHLDMIRSDGLKTEAGYSIVLNDRTYESYTFYGLGKYATYTLDVHSYLNTGANSTDYTYTCLTDPYYPDAATFNLTCYGISYTEITCHWENITQVYWNGIAGGWQLQYTGYINDYFDNVNFTMDTLTYTITSLSFDTWYVIQIRLFNQFGFGPYTSDPAKTLGFPVVNETKTRYFCYEAVPGTLEFGWESMPCTIYVGIILGLLLLTILLIIICCCQCCCKGDTKSNSNVAVNIFNEAEDKDDDYTASEDETEKESVTEDETDCKSPLSDSDSVDDGKTPPPIIAARKKKEKEANKKDDDESDASSNRDNDSEKDSTKDSDSDGTDYDSDVSGDKPEKPDTVNKDEKAAVLPIKKQKAKKILIRKSMVKTETMSIVKQKDEKENKTPDKKKKNVATPESKKKKKKPTDSDDDDSDTDYYEDWNPDALDNPDVNVLKVSNKDADKDLSGEENKNNKKTKEQKRKLKKNVEKKTNKDAKSDKEKVKNNGKGNHESEHSSDESRDYDSESDYSTESESGDDKNNKQSKKSLNKTKNKDFHIGTDSEDEWGDSSPKTSDKNDKNTGGFFGKSSDGKSSNTSNNNKYNNSDNNANKNGLFNKGAKPGQQENNGGVSDSGGWDNNANQTNSNYVNGISQEPGYPNVTHHNTTVNPVYINYDGAGRSGDNSQFPLNNANYGPYSHQNGPNNGTQNHSNNTLPFNQGHAHNYGNNTVPFNQGHAQNQSGFHQGANPSNQQGYNSGSVGNITPPGYVRGIIGGIYHKAKGNRDTTVPQGFKQNSDGSIYRDPSLNQLHAQNYGGNAMPFNQAHAQNNSSFHHGASQSNQQGYNSGRTGNATPPGYVRGIIGGIYHKARGNRDTTIPQGFKQNSDGTIYRDPSLNQPNAQNSGLAGNTTPPGYVRGIIGGIYHKARGNRDTTVPQGFKQNSDGSIYRDPSLNQGPLNGAYGFNSGSNMTNGQNGMSNQFNTGPMSHQNMNNPDNNPPDGYKINPNGTYTKKPGAQNTAVPQGFGKNSDGSLHKINGPLPSNYGYKPDGTIYRLPGNRNQTAPPGYVKNKNGTFSKLNGESYGNNANGLNAGQNLSNANSMQGNGNSSNPYNQDSNGATNGQYFPSNQRTNQALQNSGNMNGQFSNVNEYQQPMKDERQKFNDLFEAKKRKRPLRRQTINGGNATNQGDFNTNNAQVYGQGYGDGDNIFETKSGAKNSVGGSDNNNSFPNNILQNNNGNPSQNGMSQQLANAMGNSGNSHNRHLANNLNNSSVNMLPGNGRINGNKQDFNNKSNNPKSLTGLNAGQTGQQYGTGLSNNKNRLNGGNGTNNNLQGHGGGDNSNHNGAGKGLYINGGLNNGKNFGNGKLGNSNKNDNGFGSGPSQGNHANSFNMGFAANKANADYGKGQTNEGYENDNAMAVNRTGPANQGNGNNKAIAGFGNGASKFSNGNLNPNQGYGSIHSIHNPGYTNGLSTSGHGVDPSNREFTNDVSNKGFGNDPTNQSKGNNLFNHGLGNGSLNSGNGNNKSKQGTNQPGDAGGISYTGHGNDPYNSGSGNDPSNPTKGNHSSSTGFGSNPSKSGNGYNQPKQGNGNNSNNLGRPSGKYAPKLNEGGGLFNPNFGNGPSKHGFGNNPSNSHDPSRQNFGNIPSKSGFGSDPYSQNHGTNMPGNGNNKAMPDHTNPKRARVGFRKVDSAQSTSRKNSDPFGIRNGNDNTSSPTNGHDNATGPNNFGNGKKGLQGNQPDKGNDAWVVNENAPKQKRKVGTKTPVKELTLADKIPAKEAEPVTEIDRLGKKFPFLRFDNKGDKGTGADGKPMAGSDQTNPMRKNTSDTNLTLSGAIMNGNDDKKDFPSLPNTLGGSKRHFSSADLESLKPETRDKVFYGFGVGRWRIMAAKWLNKWKMKKRPVKTARSSWD